MTAATVVHHPTPIREARNRYVQALLELEDAVDCTFANIGRLAEIDVALALGVKDDALRAMFASAAVNEAGYDFLHKDIHYQVKARRMGRRGNVASVFQFRRSEGFDCAIFIMYTARLEVLGIVEVDRAELLNAISPNGATTWAVVRRIGRPLAA